MKRAESAMLLNHFARRLAAKDRRFAAIHEAGHVVIAQWARCCPLPGWPVNAWIAPTGEMPPDRPDVNGFVVYKQTWVGRAEYPSHGYPALSHKRRRMIGVAGAVAEQVWEQRFDDDPYLDLWEVADAMSNTDWYDEPGNWSRKYSTAANQVFHLLRNELWPELIRTSRTLITKRFVEMSPPPFRRRRGRRNEPIQGCGRPTLSRRVSSAVQRDYRP
jgi:hypothetical protein